jgi:hypothetical protein
VSSRAAPLCGASGSVRVARVIGECGRTGGIGDGGGNERPDRVSGSAELQAAVAGVAAE